MTLFKNVLVPMFLCCYTQAAISGIVLEGDAPQITIDPNNFLGGTLPIQKIDSITAAINDQLSRSFSSVLGSLSVSLDNFGTIDNLARGFSNANIFTLQSSSFPGIKNYESFSLSSGVSTGIQLPSLKKSEYKNMGDKLSDNPNILMGVGVGVGYLTAGYHLKKILPGLYSEISGGYIKATSGKDNPVQFDNRSLTFSTAYTLQRNRTFFKYCRWQGAAVSLGVGWQKSSMHFTPSLQPISLTVSMDNTGDSLMDQTFSGGPLLLQVFPEVTFSLASQTVSIPLMVHSSIIVFKYGRLDAGAGVSFNFGTSEVNVDGVNRISMSNLPIGMSTDEGTIALHNTNAHIAPNPANFRLYIAPGGQYKHIRLSVPLMFYAPSGISCGVSAGVEF